MKSLKLQKINIGDADILSRLELKKIIGGDYDDTNLTCIKYCTCYSGNRVACSCTVSSWDCLLFKCGGELGVCAE